MELLQDNTKLPHFFILQYKSDCGILCHDTIAMKATEFNFIYEIINKDHALIRIELNNMQVLGNNFADLIVDYVPLLSELKIDDDLILDVVCYNQSNIINLHMVFMPLNQEDYDDLLSLISFRPELFPVHFNSSGLFDDLTTQERKIQTILIPLLCQYSQIGLSLFSSLTSIQWIEVRPPMKSSSYWANGILQSGEATINILNQANLTGSNQVIGIADTGIDVNSCYFYDSNVKMVYNKVNQNHRKLIYYDTFANAADDDGHGTLVAGTSAGKCLDSSSDKKNFNGIAPNSKIAFFDIGREDKTLRLPSNLYSNLFLKLYNAGAFIQSMSWGSASNKYTNDARSLKSFSISFFAEISIYSCGISLIH